MAGKEDKPPSSDLDYAALCAAAGELQLEEGGDPQAAAALLRAALARREAAGAAEDGGQAAAAAQAAGAAGEDEEDDWEKSEPRAVLRVPQLAFLALPSSENATPSDVQAGTTVVCPWPRPRPPLASQRLHRRALTGLQRQQGHKAGAAAAQRRQQRPWPAARPPSWRLEGVTC